MGRLGLSEGQGLPAQRCGADGPLGRHPSPLVFRRPHKVPPLTPAARRTQEKGDATLGPRPLESGLCPHINPVPGHGQQGEIKHFYLGATLRHAPAGHQKAIPAVALPAQGAARQRNRRSKGAECWWRPPPPSRGAGRRKVNQNNANAAPPHPPPSWRHGPLPPGKGPRPPNAPDPLPRPRSPPNHQKAGAAPMQCATWHSWWSGSGMAAEGGACTAKMPQSVPAGRHQGAIPAPEVRRQHNMEAHRGQSNGRHSNGLRNATKEIPRLCACAAPRAQRGARHGQQKRCGRHSPRLPPCSGARKTLACSPGAPHGWRGPALTATPPGTPHSTPRSAGARDRAAARQEAPSHPDRPPAGASPPAGSRWRPSRNRRRKPPLSPTCALSSRSTRSGHWRWAGSCSPPSALRRRPGRRTRPWCTKFSVPSAAPLYDVWVTPQGPDPRPTTGPTATKHGRTARVPHRPRAGKRRSGGPATASSCQRTGR